MSKKTWIKVKRGLLEPKHIEALGTAWYLYLFILDSADWETGTIPEWKDRYAADELLKPLTMIREHRKKLVDEEYITCDQNQYSQKITILNWTDPRRYDGVIQNASEQSHVKHEPQNNDENEQGTGQGTGQGFSKHSVNENPSLCHISHTHINDNGRSLLLIKFEELTKIIQPSELIDPKSFISWEKEISKWENLRVTPRDIEDAIKKADELKSNLSWPGSITKYMTSAKAREVRDTTPPAPKIVIGSDGKRYNGVTGEMVGDNGLT